MSTSAGSVVVPVGSFFTSMKETKDTAKHGIKQEKSVSQETSPGRTFVQCTELNLNLKLLYV